MDATPLNADKTAPPKPRWRGVSHMYAFPVSLLAAVILILSTNTSLEAWLTGVFGLSISTLLGVSALYHRVQWGPEARARMRQLDHSSIYFLICGSYTVVMGLALDSADSIWILSTVWAASGLGVCLEFGLIRLPKWVNAAIYVGIGWIALFVIPQIIASLGMTAMLTIALGGVLYTLGAVVYALKRPNPSPTLFGYHEIFHLFVIAGAAVHYYAVARFVIS